jgi:magnesium transporter
MINLYYLDDNKLITEYNSTRIKQILEAKDKVCYVNVIKPTDEDMELLIQVLHLHLITIKNFSTSKHLPRVEEYENYVSTTMYDIELTNDEICYRTTPINIILMHNLTLILSKTSSTSLDEMLARISSNLIETFSDSCNLYYIALDVLVDNLFPVITCFEKELDTLQSNLLKGGDKDYTKNLMSIRGNILGLKKSFTYEKEVLYKLSYEKLNLICKEDIPYIKDVFHHIEKLSSTLTEYSDWASTLSDAYNAASTSKVNDKLQMLTIIQYIFLPLGFLTGWYGMGFKMPEVSFKYSYLVFIVIVAISTLSMLVYFKRKKML